MVRPKSTLSQRVNVSRSWIPLFAVVLLTASAVAAPNLSIEPLSWNVIGLDNNDVHAGPNLFLVGARVTNSGNAPATNLTAAFVWDSGNPLINLDGPAALFREELFPGEHEDFYFNVVVTRSAAAYDTARSYHVEAMADGVSPVTTPIPRELYVKKLVSQQRNGLNTVQGPLVMYLGRTYQYDHDTATAPSGYQQLVSYLPFPNRMFRIVSTDVTYTVPRNATNDRLYADACGWDADPLSPTYLSCVGPPNYKKGKVGGDIHTVYTVQIIGTGIADLSGIVYDLSGNSYHYTNDNNNELYMVPITVLPAPPPGFEERFYAVADGEDRLVRVDTDGFSVVGPVGAGNVEALTLAPGGTVLYGADGGQLGLINTSTGQFSATSSVFGTGNGPTGAVTFENVTGLCFDPFTLKLYGVCGLPLGGSVLFQADPASGAFVADAFGPGVDAVAIAPVAGLDRVDDLAIDPIDGQMYGVLSGAGDSVSRLVRIDKATGATQDVGALTVPGMKGLSFSSDGSLRGSTGDLDSLPAIQRNRLWIIDKTTANSRLAYIFPQYTDYRAVACMSSPANEVSGVMFRDDNGNGAQDGSEPGLSGAVVRLAVDQNQSGTFDGGDLVIQTAVTAADGSYAFTLGTYGNFVVALDVDSVVATPALTTPGEYEADFAGFGFSTGGCDFGVFPAEFEVSNLLLWGDTGTDGLLETGDTVLCEITFRNVLKQSALSADVTGTLSAGLSNLQFALVPTGSVLAGSTPTGLSVEGIVAPPDSTQSVVVTGVVCASVEDGGVLGIFAGADWTGDSVADLSGEGVSSPVSAVPAVPATLPDFCVRSYTIETVAGTGQGDYSGDGGAATDAQVYFPTQVALDAQGNLYIADRSNHVVRMVDRSTSLVSTVAGIPQTRGYSGDGGPATAATLDLPSDLAVHGNDLYIAEMGNHVIRKVDLATGTIDTVAGNGVAGYSGDGGPATAAQLNAPRSVMVDVAGNVYIGDTFNFAIRRVDAASGTIESILGTGTHGHTADGEPAAGSPVEWVMDMAMTTGCEGDPVLYFTEQDGYNLIRRIVNGNLETVAGQFGAGDWGDCGPAELSSLKKPYGLALDTRGNLYIADAGNHKVRMVDIASGLITVIAGTGEAGDSGDGGLGVAAQLNNPTGVVVSADNVLYIVDSNNHRIRAMDLDQPETVETPPFPGVDTGIIDTIAGTGVAGYEGDGADPRTKPLSYPGRLAVDAQGNVIVADRSNHRVRKIYTNWRIVTLAGTGRRGYSGDGGNGLTADLNFPTDVAVAADGTVYVSDQYNHVVRAIAPSGVIQTLAGTGAAGYNGDGPGTATQLNYPDGLALAGSTLYISDWMNHLVRALDLATGTVTTVAGMPGAVGRGGELVPATATPLDTPQGLDFDTFTGVLYIAERGNNRVRCLTPEGQIFTWAGNGISGYWGDGGLATIGQLNRPMDVVVGPGGEIYIAEYGNHVVRIVHPDGTLGTFAGTPLAPGYAGDEGPAAGAQLNAPFGVAVNGDGDLFISDRLNHVIRAVGH